MKRLISLLLVLAALIAPCFAVTGAPETEAISVVLMEKTTGSVLYGSSVGERLPPASVTKIMTLILICEAIDSGNISPETTVTASERASSMGGSQIFLKEGEQMELRELLKSVIIASANDSSVALAEAVAGSESAFVERMNRRAAELGMKDTSFKNCTGLPVEGHYTSAYDIALMSRELLKHDIIREYTTTWMDSVRGGEFVLTNTNKLIRSYPGITGLKTGYTDTAKHCISATAERDGMELIAVVIGAESSKKRFASAASLLDFGFANFCLAPVTGEDIPPVEVVLGKSKTIAPILEDETQLLLEKADRDGIIKTVTLAESVTAPVEAGQKLGELTISSGENVIKTIDIVASEAVARQGWGDIFLSFLRLTLMGEN